LVFAVLFGSVSISLGSDAPLADAAEKSDLATVRSLLKQHADVNAQQVDGMTALHWASYLDALQIGRFLVKAGADVNATNRYGVGPLSLVCVNGNTDFVELLLNAGVDANTTLRGGETVLMTAARTGRAGPVKALLAHGAKVDARERRKQTALIWAAAEDHAEVVELLIKAGADFRSPLPDSGFTPLLFAARDGARNVARVLLKAGADVNESIRPRKSVAKGPRKGMSPLLFAVENGHFELAALLLEAGANPNDQRSGFTALHALTWVRKPNCGDGEDGDPSPIGSGNLTSLQFAKKLVKHGAEVNAQLEMGKSGRGILTHRGATPFLMASATADVPYMRLLVEMGADPSLPNADGSTPLMAAAGLGCQAPTEEAGTEPEVIEAIRFLLTRHADINTVDTNGETAMHGAAYKNLPQVVKLLADSGAKVDIWNQKDKWGWTPLRIAEGYRVGNFKPSPETIAELQKVMMTAGVAIPLNTAPLIDEREDYPVKDPKKSVNQ